MPSRSLPRPARALIASLGAVLLALAGPAHAQPVKVSGTVVDDDGAPVVGAIVSGDDHETTTDARGRFTILAEGELTILADGYAPASTPARARVRIELVPSDAELIELVDDAPEETTPTEYRLTAAEIRTTPGAMNDALRAVTILPAAARIPYSFGGLVLRGMSPRDTSVFVDGVEIPIAFHFGGISGVFPTSQLEDMRVVPSGFDVSIGRTQGGAIELITRRPRRDRLRVAGEVSLLHAAVNAEGPMPGGGGFLLGIRRSYFDTLLRPFINRNDPTPSYLDGQARAVWGTVARGELTAYVLGSLDRIANSDDAAAKNDPYADGYFAANLGFVRAGAQYRRRVGTTTVQLAPFVGTNVLSAVTRDYDGGEKLDETKLRRGWYQFGGRGEWLRDDPGGFIRAGVDAAGGYLGRVGGDVVADDVEAEDLPLPRNTVLWSDVAVWAETRRHWFDDRLSVRPGIRVERYGLGNQTTLDLRLNAHVGLSDATILRGSIGRFHQPPSPAHFDEFTDNLDAQSSYVDQGTVALEWKATDALGATAAGFWHEGRRTLVDASMDPDESLPDLQGLVFRELLEEQLGFYGNQANVGRQRSYGVELAVTYRTDRFRLMANSAWSRALRSYLMPDRSWGPYGLDQPLRFNLVAATNARKWNIGVRFTAVSGNPTRLWPAGTPVEGHGDPALAPLVRLPTFWQVDLRIDRAWKKSYGTLSLFFDILNATNHRNVEMRSNSIPYDVDFDPQAPQVWGYDDTRGLPIIPTVGLELVPLD